MNRKSDKAVHAARLRSSLRAGIRGSGILPIGAPIRRLYGDPLRHVGQNCSIGSAARAGVRVSCRRGLTLCAQAIPHDFLPNQAGASA
jgi:hypothetical protein